MSDVRGYSGIAEHADPTVLAGQLRTHRQEMNAAILEEEGTVMQYVGDAVMAVFGAPFPYDDHAERALRAAQAMHRRQAAVDAEWATAGPGRLRPRHRPVDRRGGRRPAGQRRAPRVHRRRRHREPVPAPPGRRPAGRARSCSASRPSTAWPSARPTSARSRSSRSRAAPGAVRAYRLSPE